MYKLKYLGTFKFNVIAGLENAAKNPIFITSNGFYHSYYEILNKSRIKVKVNISEKLCIDISTWLNKNDLCLLEADKPGVACTINKYQVREMVQNELKKSKRHKKA